MRALLLALLFVAPAGAVDEDAPGAAAVRARGAIEALPVAARAELRKMFRKYNAQVAKRLEQGWRPGVLSDAVIEDVDEPFQPARLLEDSEKVHRKKLAELKESMAKYDRDTADYGRLLRKVQDEEDRIERIRSKRARAVGICRDWSDDVWFLLTEMNLESWTVDDRRRTARPFHAAAVACAPVDSPSVCLAFDPWVRGKPDVYALSTWDGNTVGGRVPADYFLHGLPEKAP